MKLNDPITVERKTFLDLIAAAQMSKAFMAHYIPGSHSQWANNTRQALHNAIAEAVASQPLPDNHAIKIEQTKCLNPLNP